MGSSRPEGSSSPDSDRWISDETGSANTVDKGAGMSLEASLLAQLSGGSRPASAPAGVDWLAAGKQVQMLARARGKGDLLERALHVLSTTCGADAAAVWLCDELGQQLELVGERGMEHPELEARPNWTDSYKLPLNSGGTLVGVVEAFAVGEDGFSCEQKSAIELVASTLANALHRHRLARELGALREAARDAPPDLDSLLRLWQATSHALDLPSLFESLLASLAEEVPYDAAALLVAGADGPQYYFSLRGSGSREHLDELCERACQAYLEQGGEPLSGDPEAYVLEDEGHHASDAALAAGFGVPLAQGGALAGLLYVSAVDPGAFNERQVRVLHAFAGHAVDSMERVRDLLQVELERLETIVQSLPQGVVLLDHEGEVLLANRHGREWLELLSPGEGAVSALAGKRLAALVDEAEQTGNDLTHYEVELRDQDRTYNFDLTIVPAHEGMELVGTVLSIHDISDVRQTELRLYHDARLASIGEFASGLAHELNNPMMILLGLAEVLQDAELEAGDRRVMLGEIQSAAVRAADIVKQLMVFADTQRSAGWDTIYLQETLPQAVALLVSQYEREGVQLAVALPGDLPPVQGDASRLQQVLLSLVSNAREAIVHSGQGSRVQITGQAVDDEVWIEVGDDGPGIPPDLRETIFDVFFTTKRDYQGKGLGLSIAHRIAREHAGRLSLEECPLGGALFRLALPRHHWASD